VTRSNSNDVAGIRFAEVLEAELNLLDSLRLPKGKRRKRSGTPAPNAGVVYKRALDSGLAGLAFSGGGVRSATFNLGFIQALAHYGLLTRFDYLSTVSGGGYIGGWLSALLHGEVPGRDKTVGRDEGESLQNKLGPHPRPPESTGLQETVGFDPVEHKAVRYVRCYSNFLSPRRGLSGDMVANVAVFLRNFVVVQLLLTSLVACLMLLAYFVVTGSRYLVQDQALLLASVTGTTAGLGATLTPLVFAVSFAAWFFVRSGDASGREGGIKAPISAEPLGERAEKRPNTAAWKVVLYVIFPCSLFAWQFSVATAAIAESFRVENASPGEAMGRWAFYGAAVYAVAWALGCLVAGLRARLGGKRADERSAGPTRHGSASDRRFGFVGGLRLLLAPLVSGALLGLLLFTGVWNSGKYSVDVWHAVTFGPPLMALALTFAATLHIGIAGPAFSEMDREWLARLGGFLLFVAVTWAFLFALVLYSAPLVHWLAGGGVAALIAWASGSSAGAWLARSPRTGGVPKGFQPSEIAARLAPWLFLVGLCVIVAYLVHVSLVAAFLDSGIPLRSTGFVEAASWTLLQLGQLRVVDVFQSLMAVAFVLLCAAFLVDINLFSLHTPYANRLIRAYLGARNAGARRPNPFTGFDENDDLEFHALRNQRPIPIINTAVNMTGGDDLGWQTRRAASFSFTPGFSGFETLTTQGKERGTYRPTAEFGGGLTLGTLIATSGAAASPNMGYHTSASVAALLTAFNLRLGRWCGNPARQAGIGRSPWQLASPSDAVTPILAELTGSATAEAEWINLTDGGHFDNLGVYELIRRRCRLIVVTDAGCDPKYQFEDLANLLRKCWTDLGVNIRFANFDLMREKKTHRMRKYHGVIGRIEYKAGRPNDRDGVFVYVKCSMTGDEWPDIRQYADVHADFPHETTADQFFDENQFEAYRHLGYKVGAKMVRMWGVRLGFKPGRLENGADNKYRAMLRRKLEKASTRDLIAKLLQAAERGGRPAGFDPALF